MIRALSLTKHVADWTIEVIMGLFPRYAASLIPMASSVTRLLADLRTTASSSASAAIIL